MSSVGAPENGFGQFWAFLDEFFPILALLQNKHFQTKCKNMRKHTKISMNLYYGHASLGVFRHKIRMRAIRMPGKGSERFWALLSTVQDNDFALFHPPVVSKSRQPFKDSNPTKPKLGQILRKMPKSAKNHSRSFLSRNLATNNVRSGPLAFNCGNLAERDDNESTALRQSFPFSIVP